MEDKEHKHLKDALQIAGTWEYIRTNITLAQFQAVMTAAKERMNNMGESVNREGTGADNSGSSPSPAITDEKRQAALDAVNEWFDSIEWTEAHGTPFKYKGSEDVLFYHGKTIRSALQAPSVDRDAYEDIIGKIQTPLNIICSTMKDQTSPVAKTIYSWARQGLDDAEKALSKLRRGR